MRKERQATSVTVDSATALAAAVLVTLGAVAFFKWGLLLATSSPRLLFGLLVASYLLAWGGYALISRVPRNEIRKEFLLVTLSTATVLALIELPAWMNLLDYRGIVRVVSIDPWERPADYILDRELLSLPKPNRSLRIVFNRGDIGDSLCLPSRESEPFILKYDRNGFRNEADLTSVDIAVIGDSFVSSLMMPVDSLATTHLSALQKKSVANLGQGWFGPQQELVVMKRYALPLHPKWIVWMFYEGNDLRDVERYEQTVSLLDRKWGEVNTPWHRSFTRSVLVAASQFFTSCEPDARLLGNYGTVPGDDGKETRIYFADHTTSAALSLKELEQLKKTGEAIKAAHALALEAGAHFMVVFAPTAFRVYHDIAKLDRDSVGDIKWWVPSDLPDRFYRMVKDISPEIHYVDLTRSLRAAASTQGLMYISDDSHWTAKGHRVAAETIDAALRGSDLIHVAGKEDLVTDRQGLKIDVAQDAIVVRNRDGTIRYWSEGARKMYGWERQKALGQVSHRLLKTIFPMPPESIEARLLSRGSWEGHLIHERRDGIKVKVASRWELQQDVNAKDQSVTIIEVHRLVRDRF